jgi:hypothetical protein
VSDGPGVVFASDRTFEVWTWGAGHRGLVLRSIPGDGGLGRVEIWFKPAFAACLPAYLPGIVISAVDGDPGNECIAVLGRQAEPWEHLFSIGGGTEGWVLAGGVHGRQDDHDGDELPLFDGWGLKPGQRSLFSLVPNHRGRAGI